MRPPPFSRPTVIAAIELLEVHSQARFNQDVLRRGFKTDVPAGTELSVAKKGALCSCALRPSNRRGIGLLWVESSRH